MDNYRLLERSGLVPSGRVVCQRSLMEFIEEKNNHPSSIINQQSNSNPKCPTLPT